MEESYSAPQSWGTASGKISWRRDCCSSITRRACSTISPTLKKILRQDCGHNSSNARYALRGVSRFSAPKIRQTQAIVLAVRQQNELLARLDHEQKVHVAMR